MGLFVYVWFGLIWVVPDGVGEWLSCCSLLYCEKLSSYFVQGDTTPVRAEDVVSDEPFKFATAPFQCQVRLK